MATRKLPHPPDHDQASAYAPQRAGGPLTLGTIYPCAVAGVSLTSAPSPDLRGWGPACDTSKLGMVTLSNGVHFPQRVELVELTTLIMNADIRDGYIYRQADTGAYNCRVIAGTNIESWHAWPVAIDKNWTTNPQHSPLITDYPVWLLQRWNRYGFRWGGNYNAPTVPDAMHHEFMGTPAQAAAATDLARSELSGQPTASAIDAHYDDPALDLHNILGAPTTAELVCPDGVGHFRHYTNNGSIYWTPGTGAWSVHGAIRGLWISLGWETSYLGYPVTDEYGTPDGVGRYNHFQHGSIYFTVATGAQPVSGAIKQAWANSGWEAGPWGYPTAPPVTSGSTTTQAFQHGTASEAAGNTNPAAVQFGTAPVTSGQLPAREKSPITGTLEIPGYDASYTKPNPSTMRAAGYLFVVGYVSPTSGKNLSAGDYNAARSAGLAVGLVWESTAGRALTGGSAGGQADGAAAESQANALGYPVTAPIFFAVDQDTTSANYAAIQAYANAFNAATRRPVGIYGEADVVDHFVTPGVAPVRYGWQTAAWSGGRLSTKANLYQRVGHPGWPVPAGVASTAFDEDVALLYVPLAGW